MVTSLLFSLLANVIYFRPQFFIADADNVYYADAQRIQTEMSGILPDYIPVTMPTKVEPASNLVLSDFNPDQIEVLSNRTHEKLIKTNFDEPTDLLLAICSLSSLARLVRSGTDTSYKQRWSFTGYCP